MAIGERIRFFRNLKGYTQKYFGQIVGFSEKTADIRIAQYGVGEYGKGLIIYEIDEVEPVYKEHEVKRVMPEDVPVESDRKFTGIHTYNSLGDIEVIDLKYTSYSLSEYIARKRVRKVFLNKY